MPTFRYEDTRTQPSKKFQCKLKTRQCDGRTRSGARCTRPVAQGLRTCFQHREGKHGLRVGPSKIPGAGKGLFSTRAFKKNELISPGYTGEKVSEAKVDRRYGKDGLGAYTAQSIGNRLQLDSACRRGIVAHANGAKTFAQSNIRMTNPAADGKSINVRANRSIPAGTELLFHYGPGYNKLMGDARIKHSTR